MASDLQVRAKEAFVDDHFELAADLLTQAIALNPNDPELYADRAQANIKLLNFTEAISDTNKAIELNPQLSKAYLRKGIACMNLEEYQTAKIALMKGASLAPEDSRFIAKIEECDKLIAAETSTITIQEKISSPEVSSKYVKPENDLPKQVAESVAKPKYRLVWFSWFSCSLLRVVILYVEFYQKPDEVVVTIFAKGIPRDRVSVDFGEQIISVRIDVPDEHGYFFQPRLFGKIIPAKCRYEVLSTKIEIRLAKAEHLNWTSLEFTRQVAVQPKVNVPSVSAGPRPTYPSSKPTRVDWDKLEAQVKKEEKEEKLDGDAALNKFFREIYQDADEDTRRAMRKSFVESNGTVLSTNWKEVGSKKVEGSPPDGMELKKWEY
ncbi:protein SGT1-like protein [Senna tora]|uniref:Protein SGT1 homolog n=1 Tax=Senna tora TaxID=362788 RepID=A0A834T2F6_9FABA|nr:protein SGT1-like protein [Senna tora]